MIDDDDNISIWDLEHDYEASWFHKGNTNPPCVCGRELVSYIHETS